MGALQSVVVLVFLINGFLIAAGPSLPPEIDTNVAETAISGFINVGGDQVLLNETAAVKVPKSVSTNTVESTSTGFNFVDVLRTPFDMFTTIMSFLVAPINIANALALPLAINLLVMGPITVLFYVSIAIWLRGGGSG